MKSSHFSTDNPNEKLKWCLRVNPKVRVEEACRFDFLILYNRVSTRRAKNTYRCICYFCQTNRKSAPSSNSQFSMSKARRQRQWRVRRHIDLFKVSSFFRLQKLDYIFYLGKDWGFKKFIRRDFLMDESNGLLPNDQLTLFCEVSVVQDSVNIHGHSHLTKLVVPECTLTNDLGALLQDKTFADVVFEVDGVEYSAHKAIMAARSEVFRY